MPAPERFGKADRRSCHAAMEIIFREMPERFHLFPPETALTRPFGRKHCIVNKGLILTHGCCNRPAHTIGTVAVRLFLPARQAQHIVQSGQQHPNHLKPQRHRAGNASAGGLKTQALRANVSGLFILGQICRYVCPFFHADSIRRFCAKRIYLSIFFISDWFC